MNNPFIRRIKNPVKPVEVIVPNQEEVKEVEDKKMVEGYCVRCKKNVEMKDPQETATKRGTLMFKGKCPTCGTTVCRIGGKK